ncbi:hypothetical protein SUGI_0862190 [Cryptomeria japonica]|uniref:ATP-dependent RNA helicase SUV3, mitochondrial-like n=1 Tax=Cryptomeria japonica TaxID=3369 RepID=UPI002414AC68|nr:ATP-dependent RNA helicase SUV3, mitochondrial-like [Cryptomeria japonica]GLJ41663.1 hypothetical protein SUGI_0862190 [Cryptomeria japonica]
MEEDYYCCIKEADIERYSQDIWNALLDIYDGYANLKTTITMLCPKCAKPDPSSQQLHSLCTQCCLEWSIQELIQDLEISESWKIVKWRLDVILEDIKKFHMPLKNSLEYTDIKKFKNLKWAEGDPVNVWMQLDYMSFLKNYCPAALMDIILNFWRGIFLKNVFVKYMNCDRVHQEPKRLLSLCGPLQWYPRKNTDFRRKITFHFGPTNSGTTFEAFKSFKAEGKSAIYCAPLSLLAIQVYQDVNKQGILCDLITGEDVKHYPGSVKWCCSVEKVDLSKKWDVGVIDEIQMIGDDLRGGAWTRAFFGLNADEIHLCGENSVVELIQDLCELTGDRLTMVKHNRRTQLVVEKEALVLGKSKIESGDCFVGFSERKLREIKKTILQHQSFVKCTLLYGSLPPELILEEAENFLKDTETQKTVLLATDAIVLGLNLPLRRVIFTETKKYDPRINSHKSSSPVNKHLINQIAGRAGRGSEIGYCTATDSKSLEYLTSCLEALTEPIKLAVLDLDPTILPILEHRWRKLGQFRDSNFVRYIKLCMGFRKLGLGKAGVGNSCDKVLFRFTKFPTEFWNLANQIAVKDLMPRITLSDFLKLCNCPCEDPLVVVSWMTNMFSTFTECPFNYLNGAFDYNMNEHTFEGVYSLVRAYKYLYTQFPQQRSLMIHYDRLPELELQIKRIIRQREKKEEEYWLRYPLNSEYKKERAIINIVE